MNASSHTLDIRFDAKGLDTSAGLVLPATLAQRLGLPELLRQHVHLGKVAGAANPDRKAMTAIASLLAGGDHVDDINALRPGRVGAEILGRDAGRGLDGGHLPARVHLRSRSPAGRSAGGLPSAGLGETYGLQKQGGADFTYLHTRGYHPLLAVIAETGEVVHSRLRQDRASAGRGAASFAA